MIAVRWSTVNAKSTWKPVIAIQGLLETERLSHPSRIRPVHIHATMAAGSAVNSSATPATAVRGSLRPTVPLIRKPTNGRSGMYQSREAGIVS